MGLLILHNRAQHTHENEQFRRIASSLKILFKQQNWSGILIGNPFNETYSRFRADAILLYNHGLLIIDFKDYSGTIKLPTKKIEFETMQWYSESDEDKKRILIKAGSKFINPFKQLNSYREAFKEIVKNEIRLNGLIQESKTCIINIFSGPLTFDNAIPKEIPFYKITQELDLATFLYDYSSDNSYSEETANILSRIFNAEEWFEHIELPKAKRLTERTVEINENVEIEITEFLKTEESGILVLDSMSVTDRDNWVHYIQSEAFNYGIPQIETWVHSARIARKASQRLGNELQSLFNTIYGGAPKTLETNTVETDEKQFEEQLQEIIPIRSDDTIDNSALIILYDAHLVTRSLHQSELLRFGSGRLLEDLIKFLNLEDTNRKLICIGDPYSLTYGKDSECAINLNTLAELSDKIIKFYKEKPVLSEELGKIGIRGQLALSIENKIFNNLGYPWKENDLVEINKEQIPTYLTEWFSKPFDGEPSNAVMVYSNKDAKKINLWIKNHCLKNGAELAKNDLLLVNNNINIPHETGFGHPTKLYNGMYLLVEEIMETISKIIPLRQSTKPIQLNFTKVKVKCLSLQTKQVAEVWLLNNYFQSEDKLSKEEQIAFRVFVNMLVTEKVKEQRFIDSHEYIQLNQDRDYKTLLKEEKDLKVSYESGEKVKTKLDQKQRELKKIENSYNKQFRNRILSGITQTNPLVNAVYANYGWALTVHKSLGSSFNNAILNTHQGENKGITNSEYFRWLYSGITATYNTIRIANPQTINPLLEINFHENLTEERDKIKASLLYFEVYEPETRYLEKLPVLLKVSTKAAICELSKVLEKQGYLLELVKPNGDYLTKSIFSVPSASDKELIIAINNKGEKDNWAVSSIRIEKNSGLDENEFNSYVKQLFAISQLQDNSDSIEFPTDFRGAVYKKWKDILESNGFDLQIIEAHNNQDVFSVSNNVSKAKFRVWYRNDGFFSQFIILEKSDEYIITNLKTWLLDGN